MKLQLRRASVGAVLFFLLFVASTRAQNANRILDEAQAPITGATLPIQGATPQHEHLALRYQPTFWRGKWQFIEASSDLVGTQTRLSGRDITDERIGASVCRRDIASFFRGSLIRPLLRAGVCDWQSDGRGVGQR